MFQLYQDSMAIACFCHRIDFFSTMTANPKWKEITQELLPGQSASDRPDLVTRVFQMKKQALLKDITKNGILGLTIAHIHTIEFQKRGLPHMYLLIVLDPNSRLHTPEDVDEIICAEFPDETLDPELHAFVLQFMTHGPCNARCKDSTTGQCTKGFPKRFRESTILNENSYVSYHRRNDGRKFKCSARPDAFEYENCHVVPYSRYLLLKYECHINIECCMSIKSVKYIHKYIYKSSDRATIEEQHRQNEVQKYIDARYVSASEAIWRILRFKMHAEVPSVTRLQVHLENEQNVLIQVGVDNNATVLNRALNRNTTLTAYFQACASDANARQYLYQEFPQHYRWLSKTSKWAIRKNKIFSLGRMYFVPPKAGELFHLRTLLTVVHGPTSFQDLQTFNGVNCETYHAACIARGLLEDDGE